jgi:hypothetical protein
METSLSHSLVRLGTEEFFRVDAARGRCLVVFHGKVWITQHDDPTDYVLSSGETFTFDRRGRALVEALEPTSLVVMEEATPTPDPIGYEAAWPQTEPVQLRWSTDQVRDRARATRARTTRELARKAWASLVSLTSSSATPLRDAA